MRFLNRFFLILCLPTALSAVEIQAPDQAALDSEVEVQITGEVASNSFVTIVAPETAEGEYGTYTYTRSATINVLAPPETGRFEVRLLAADRPFETLARKAIELVMPEASMTAPARVDIGANFTVEWTGPSHSREYITLVPAGTPDGQYKGYKYTRGEGSGTASFSAPAQPGDYELRYMSGSKRVVLARRPVIVGDVAASVTFEPTVTMGASMPIAWQGPGNDGDFITIVPVDAGPKAYDGYAYTKASPVTLAAPEVPGTYEVRYLSADSSRILARGTLQVGAATATVQAPEQVEAGTDFEVAWSGPDNALDYIAVTVLGQPKDYRNYAYTKRGNPSIIDAPREPGTYEIHYLTGRTDQSLARQTIEVTPTSTPGSLRVTMTSEGDNTGNQGAVELILDASGSMLKSIDGQRRIKLAMAALDQLVQKTLEPGTPVALRVFGHRKPDACDTALLAPLAPLDRAALRATIAAVEAKNLAKTPIAASLAAVASDLAGVEGPAVVVLVTDGEETCDGDPAAEIERLRSQGLDVVLNIVGFAIDERALEREFQRWAELGGGAYFAANDGNALSNGIAQALRPPFGVYQDGQRVASGVAGGEAVPLRPGRYEVRLGDRRETIEVVASEETRLDL